MRKLRSPDPVVEALVGYSADPQGKGLAYARVIGRRARQLLRVAFRVTAARPFPERAVGYDALTAIARALSRRGVREARFLVADAAFVEEVASGRGISDALAMSYVRLRCALNALTKFTVQAAPTDDLTQRAQAEVALNVAA
ncbi:MAG: hypothetical protein JO092_09960 [Candidatus Eremiobacteraeota bacterium]|nr:hypothetical protein [Candidatus Eremiobacteraeota bacterium]